MILAEILTSLSFQQNTKRLDIKIIDGRHQAVFDTPDGQKTYDHAYCMIESQKQGKETLFGHDIGDIDAAIMAAVENDFLIKAQDAAPEHQINLHPHKKAKK